MAMPMYVISDKYKRWHLSLPWQNQEKKNMRCKCGWRYGLSIFQRRSAMPADLHMREKCHGPTGCFATDPEYDDSDIDS